MGRVTKPFRVYAVLPALIPSSIINIIKPFFELERRSAVAFDFAVSPRWSARAIAAADIVIFHRSNTLAELRALRLAEQLGKPVVYDIDDNLFEMPLDSALGRAMRDSLAVGVMDRFVRSAGETRVYSPLMREVISERGGRPTLQHTYFELPGHSVPQPPRARGGALRIAFASTRTGGENVERPMEDALVRIAERYGEGVEFLFWKPPAPAVVETGRARLQTPIADYRAFLRRLASLQVDIGLAPLGDDRFFRSKTNNKYREYGGMRIAGIYSDVDLYRACVVHGENGLLASNSAAAWETALARAIEDADLRQRIAAAAARDVAENYSLESFLNGWLTSLEHALNVSLAASRQIARRSKFTPVILFPREARPTPPLAARVAEIARDLGGHVVRSAALPLPPGSVLLRTPGEAPQLRNNALQGAIQAFDLTAFRNARGLAQAELAGSCVITRAGSLAAGSVPPSARIPDSRQGEGLYDADGADARLLAVAEALLDRAPVIPTRLPIAISLRFRRVANRRRLTALLRRLRERLFADQSGGSALLRRLSGAPRLLAAVLRRRVELALYERRLRRSRQV